MRIDYSDDSFLAPREYFYEKRDLTLLMVNEKTRDEEVRINGKIDGNGFIYVDDDGVIRIENICNKNYCANGTESNIIITENELGEIPKLDKVDPMIKLNGNPIVYVNINGEYKEEGATARTKLGEKLEYTKEIRLNGEVVDSIETSREATYKIIYTTINNEKMVSVERTIEILDMTPVITMTEPNVNYVKGQDVLINVSAIRPNKVKEFTYQINEETPVKVIGITRVIKLNTTGEYTIKINVTDDNGNTATKTKTYKIDVTGPQIVFETNPVELESETVREGYNLLTGVSVTDNIDETIDNSEITIGGDELLTIPGTYNITYTVSDGLGNKTTTIRTFIVKDLTKPEIVIMPNSTSRFMKSQTITIKATDNIKVESISYVIIKDGVRGTSTSIDNGGSITLNSTGNYEIEVTAIDDSNNSKTETSGTYKIDHTPPTITIVKNAVTLGATEVTGYDIYNSGIITTSDNSNDTVTLSVISGTLLETPGTYTLTYRATDIAGNTSEGTYQITFTVVEADGPRLNVSSQPTTWLNKDSNRTFTVTAIDNSKLNSFSYEVIKDGTSQGVTNVVTSGAANAGMTLASDKKSASASITFSTSGKYKIRLKATNEHGYTSGVSTIWETSEYKVDIDPPSPPTTMEYVFADASKGYTQGTWTNINVYAANPVTVTGPSGSTDNLSQVAKYQISSDNVNWYDYAYNALDSMYGMTEEGTHTRYFRAVDNAGNVSTSISRTAKIDKTGPSAPTSMEFVYADSSSYTQGRWTNKNVYAANTGTPLGPRGSTDSLSQVAKYQISSDNVNWYDYAYNASDSMYGMTKEGTHTRYFRAVDNAGNVSTSISRTAKIDKTGPSAPTTMEFVFADGSKGYTQGTWTNKNVYAANPVTVTGPSGSTDNLSQVAKYQISSDNVNWYDYAYNASDSMYGMTKEGTHTRYFRAVDNAGNVSTSISRTAKIDKTGPSAPTYVEFVLTNGWIYQRGTWAVGAVYAVNSGASAAGGSVDNLSGVAKYQISSDNTTWTDYVYDITKSVFVMKGEGEHVRYFRAVDNVGNVSPSISRTAKIDPYVGYVGSGSWSTPSREINTFTMLTGNTENIVTVGCHFSWESNNYQSAISVVATPLGNGYYSCAINAKNTGQYNQIYQVKVYVEGKDKLWGPYYATTKIP